MVSTRAPRTTNSNGENSKYAGVFVVIFLLLFFFIVISIIVLAFKYPDRFFVGPYGYRYRNPSPDIALFNI